MGKRIIAVIFLLIITNMYSQNEGKIRYNLVISQDFSKNELYNKYVNLANSGANNLSFILEYKNNLSKFYIEDKLTNNDKNAKIAIAMTDYDNVIYCNSTNDTIIYHNRNENIFKKEEFLIIEKKKIDWKITNESKIIQNFLSYKAVSENTYYEGENKFSKKIVAWFCPEFPLKIGPMGFNGLSGLILELSIDNVVFGVNEINFNLKINEIKLPSTGEKISREKYIETILSRREKRFVDK